MQRGLIDPAQPAMSCYNAGITIKHGELAMTRILQTIVLLAILALLAAGCQPYINIPAQRGDTASHNPNGKTAREVMAVAIRAAIDDAGITEPVQISLPDRAEPITYAAIARAVGDPVVLPDSESGATGAVVGVRAVRVRGVEGEVDVVRPAGGGHEELVTVHLKWDPVVGWGAERVQTWRGVIE